MKNRTHDRGKVPPINCPKHTFIAVVIGEMKIVTGFLFIQHVMIYSLRKFPSLDPKGKGMKVIETYSRSKERFLA